MKDPAPIETNELKLDITDILDKYLSKNELIECSIALNYVIKRHLKKQEKIFTKEDMKTAFTQSRCNNKDFDLWYEFNYKNM